MWEIVSTNYAWGVIFPKWLGVNSAPDVIFPKRVEERKVWPWGRLENISFLCAPVNVKMPYIYFSTQLVVNFPLFHVSMFIASLISLISLFRYSWNIKMSPRHYMWSVWLLGKMMTTCLSVCQCVRPSVVYSLTDIISQSIMLQACVVICHMVIWYLWNLILWRNMNFLK